MDEKLAAVAQLMGEGRFDDVATTLDEVELEVRARSAEGLRPGLSPACPPVHAFWLPQEPSALSSERWPHAVHLLAHIYAGRL
jgi:hypothetical protein